MNVILILRIFLTAAGVLFLLGDINAYVRQKLTDTIGLLWAFVSVALILTGVVSVPGAREEEYVLSASHIHFAFSAICQVLF